MEDVPDSDEPDPSTLTVPICWDASVDDLWKNELPEERVREAVRVAVQSRGFTRGEIGVRITSDEDIHQLNVEYLAHDYPTDVISFPYEAEGDRVVGELVVSCDTAARNALSLDCTRAEELLLYIVHGTLHVTGMDDQEAESRRQMRSAERSVLAQLGIDLQRFQVDAQSGGTER